MLVCVRFHDRLAGEPSGVGLREVTLCLGVCRQMDGEELASCLRQEDVVGAIAGLFCWGAQKVRFVRGSILLRSVSTKREARSSRHVCDKKMNPTVF